ncbi:hypothetical protein AAHB43_12270 [Staphylococcus pseudintermedius]
MLTAYNVQSQQILATHARKEEVYHCPICKEVLILRQGVRKRCSFCALSTFNGACTFKRRICSARTM